MHVTAARHQITRCLPHVKASDPSRPLCAPGATRTSGGDPGGKRPHKSTGPHVATWALIRDAPHRACQDTARRPSTLATDRAPPSPACRPAQPPTLSNPSGAQVTMLVCTRVCSLTWSVQSAHAYCVVSGSALIIMASVPHNQSS